MANCGTCGAPITGAARFCPKCGQPAGAPTIGQSTQTAAAVQAAPSAAQIHLKRAGDLIGRLADATEELKQRVLRHEAEMDQRVESDSGSFVADFAGILVSGAKGKRNLGRDKSSLLSDIQLAHSELDQAAAIDAGVTIPVDGTDVGIPNLRAGLFRINGFVEMIFGTSERAKQLLLQSSALVEDPYTHYLLGSVYESDYQPKEALKHFERCLELDPNGENSVSALRDANAMRNYKKKFRGNWLLLIFLFCCYIVPGVIYWRKKYK